MRSRGPAERASRSAVPWLLAMVAAAMVSRSAGPLLLPLIGLSPDAAAAAARHAEAPQVLAGSAWTAATATVLAVLAGVPLGYLLARRAFRGADAVTAVAYVLLALPPLLGGVAVLCAVGPRGPLGLWLAAHGAHLAARWLVVGAQAAVSTPYMIITARLAFGTVEASLEDVTLSLGKPPLVAFARVSLPLAGPWILAGVPLVWLRAFGESGAGTAAAALHRPLLAVPNVQAVSRALPTLAMLLGGSVAVYALFHVFVARGDRAAAPAPDSDAHPGVTAPREAHPSV